jgi:hypothetical protein
MYKLCRTHISTVCVREDIFRSVQLLHRKNISIIYVRNCYFIYNLDFSSSESMHNKTSALFYCLSNLFHRLAANRCHLMIQGTVNFEFFIEVTPRLY